MDNDDDDPGTLGKIEKLLSKSDLKSNEESENSVDIMSQKNVDNLKQVDPVKEKLVNAQKMLEHLEFDMPYTPEGITKIYLIKFYFL